MPRAAREQLMIEVATRAFAEHGYHACSMEEIAEAAGVTKPMVYAYFGSKEGLYVACMEAVSGPLLEAIAIENPDLPPDRQLWVGINAFFSHVDGNRTEWRRLYLDASAIGGDAAQAAERVRHNVVRVVSQLIVEGAKGPEIDDRLTRHIDPLAHAFVGAAEALTRWWLDYPEESTERVAARLMNFAWMGFGRLVAGEIWSPDAR